MKVLGRPFRPMKILKSCILIGLVSLGINVCQASVSVGMGVFPQPYPVYYPPAYPEPEWIPGHWYRGYWIPGHYVAYGNYGYYPAPVPAPVIMPGPGFIYYHNGGHWHHHHWCH